VPVVKLRIRTSRDAEDREQKWSIERWICKNVSLLPEKNNYSKALAGEMMDDSVPNLFLLQIVG